MTARYRLLGIDDEVTVCDLCGKANLKCTMALEEFDEDGNDVGVVRFGRDCGARALRWPVTPDYAEKLVRGTAAIPVSLAEKAWARYVNRAGYLPLRDPSPVSVEHKGVALEVWSTGRSTSHADPPGEGWHPVKDSPYRWRLAC